MYILKYRQWVKGDESTRSWVPVYEEYEDYVTAENRAYDVLTTKDIVDRELMMEKQ